MSSVILRRIANFSSYLKNGGYLLSNGYSNLLPNATVDAHRTSKLNKDRIEVEHYEKEVSSDYRKKYPEFLPDPEWWKRDSICEKMERRDMFRRRCMVKIPEFYVGSILAVTVADKFGKENRFVGLCIQRAGHGLRHNFTLRNVIDDQGVEVMYEMYNPLIQKIEVLKLEKRLDEELLYLRDCPLEYSYVPPDLEPSMLSKYEDVPINTVKVPTNPHPWTQRWERMNLQGVELVYKHEKGKEKLTRLKNREVILKPWEKEDIMKHYRESINTVEEEQIYSEVIRNKGKWKKK